MQKNNNKDIRLCILRVVSAASLSVFCVIVGILSCGVEEHWYVSVHFMSPGYAYEEVHYQPGDYVYVEARTPIALEYPGTITLSITTDEGDEELVSAMWVEDSTQPELYIHRASMKMVAPVDPVVHSGFIEAHYGTAIIVEYTTADDRAVDTAYVQVSD